LPNDEIRNEGRSLVRRNDILLIEGRHYSPSKFLEQIKLDFDQLYKGQNRRYQHDRSTHLLDHAYRWCCNLACRRFKQGSG